MPCLLPQRAALEQRDALGLILAGENMGLVLRVLGFGIWGLGFRVLLFEVLKIRVAYVGGPR